MRVPLVRPLLSPLVLYFSTVYRAVRPRALPVRDSDETLRLPGSCVLASGGAVMGVTGSNLMHSPFPALNASLAPQYEGDIAKECICEKVDSDEEKSIVNYPNFLTGSLFWFQRVISRVLSEGSASDLSRPRPPPAERDVQAYVREAPCNNRETSARPREARRGGCTAAFRPWARWRGWLGRAPRGAWGSSRDQSDSWSECFRQLA